MKITCLIENSPSPDNSRLFFEHGLSLHIAYRGHSILFDMGKSDRFADNASLLGIDIGSVDAAVLSHHHYDHGGGLQRFFEANPNANVLLKPQPSGECVARAWGKKLRYIGLDKSIVANEWDRFLVVRHFTEIMPEVFVITDIQSTFPKPRGNRFLFLHDHGRFRPDPFDHELFLVIRDENGLVVFTGCAHNGILNILATTRSEFPNYPIKAVIGGFHLTTLPVFGIMADNRATLKAIAGELTPEKAGAVHTGHCTGQKAYTFLSNLLPGNCCHLTVGTILTIEDSLTHTGTIS